MTNHQLFEDRFPVYTEKLIQVGAEISNTDKDKNRQLVSTLMAIPNADQAFEPGGKTGINSDGTPLQYCISVRKEGWGGRFLADPAHTMGNPFERFVQSRIALKKLFQISGTHELKHFCEEMLDFHLPKGEGLSAYRDGVLWLGAPASGNGIAVYMDGRSNGWKKFEAWLNQLGISATIQALSTKATILSIGFEGSSLKNLRVKVYWRLKEPCLLDDLGIDLLKDPEYKIFLNELVQDQEIKLTGLVFSAGFHLASQQLFDCKIDVCTCKNCVSKNPDQWAETLAYFTEKYELAAFPIHNELHEKKCEVSYLGFGMDILGNKRMNLYLKAYGTLL